MSNETLEMPESAMLWRGQWPLIWAGTWAVKRYPANAIEYIRADLAAPKVKPLAWIKWHVMKFPHSDYCRAETPIKGLRYTVSQVAPDKPFRVSDGYGDIALRVAAIDEAKAAAQADYERRILEALE